MHGRNPAGCTHRWVLSEPQPQSIQGVCRRCGAHRRYPSVLELPESPSEAPELDAKLAALASAARAMEEEAFA